MKKMIFILPILFSLSFSCVSGQKQIILVEHFTNTLCPVCFANNPGLHQVINKHTDRVIRISIHPSVPYIDCPLYNYNVEDNGAREHFYVIYATPTMFINGKRSTGSATSFEVDLNEEIDNFTAQALLYVEHGPLAYNDNIVHIDMNFSNEEIAESVKLFVALVEKSVLLSSGNQVMENFDVMRKFISSRDGDDIVLEGKKARVSMNFDIENSIMVDQAYIIAFVQNVESKAILGSASSFLGNVVSAYENHEEILLFPNPASNSINLEWEKEMQKIALYNLRGQEVISQKINPGERNARINVSGLAEGLYLFTLVGEESKFQRRLIIY